jgi:hypothetical protein
MKFLEKILTVPKTLELEKILCHDLSIGLSLDQIGLTSVLNFFLILK